MRKGSCNVDLADGNQKQRTRDWSPRSKWPSVQRVLSDFLAKASIGAKFRALALTEIKLSTQAAEMSG
jgi:hypothetical protein